MCHWSRPYTTQFPLSLQYSWCASCFLLQKIYMTRYAYLRYYIQGVGKPFFFFKSQICNVLLYTQDWTSWYIIRSQYVPPCCMDILMANICSFLHYTKTFKWAWLRLKFGIKVSVSLHPSAVVFQQKVIVLLLALVMFVMSFVHDSAFSSQKRD